MDAASPDGPLARDGTSLLGPGRLVLVVGPSGAGKDSLIGAARDALAGDEHHVFPRRYVTRPSSAAEESVEVSDGALTALRERGALAVWWSAHGLGYGLPRSIDDDLRAGRAVICNVSRSVVPELQGRYANTLVVEITAPPHVLEVRLASRARSTDGSLRDRRERNALFQDDFRPDVSVDNAGSLDLAARRFLEIIRRGAPRDRIVARRRCEMPA